MESYPNTKVTAQDKKTPLRAVFRLYGEVAELKQKRKELDVAFTKQDRSIKALQADLDVRFAFCTTHSLH
jgi:hypothetical protein